MSRCSKQTCVDTATRSPRRRYKRIAERLERINHSIQTEQFAVAAPEKKSQASIDAVATAAVARALFEREIDDVIIRPIPSKATFFAQSMSAEEENSELPPPAVFIPAQPRRPAGRPRRMPRVDELPIPV